MNDARIAILGGYGAVGSVATRLLAQTVPGAALRIGGRDPSRARALVARELGDSIGQATMVDVWDDAGLARFCAGANVVVNCAGPSYRVLERVALAALDAGAHYVDAGGDEPVFGALSGRDVGDRVAVLSAGMMPGLTGLLPRWLARQGFGTCARLTAHVGTMDRMTPAGAAEYLLSLGGVYGEAQAAWRNGARALRALNPVTDTELPFFPGRVDAYPYLSFESERTVRALGVADADWFTVYDGGSHVMNSLSRLQGAISGQSDPATAAAELTRAAALDLFGRDPYQLMVFELAGTIGGQPLTRTLVLRGSDTYELTGLMTAMSATAILAGRIPRGTHFAAEALAADEVVDELRRLKAVTMLELFDAPAAALAAAEEGEL